MNYLIWAGTGVALVALARVLLFRHVDTATDGYGDKHRIMSKGPKGITVAYSWYSGIGADSTELDWEQVKSRFPSHTEEAEARLAEAKARREAAQL